MDKTTCMVDVAKYFLDFTRNKSCGKCIPCREGTMRMYEIVERISEGKGTTDDLALLRELGSTVYETSRCGLGKNALNPLFTTLKYFGKEYELHLKEREYYEIIQEKCTGCGLCLKNCLNNAIIGEKKKPHKINNEKCIRCGICFEKCKFNAIRRG